MCIGLEENLLSYTTLHFNNLLQKPVLISRVFFSFHHLVFCRYFIRQVANYVILFDPNHNKVIVASLILSLMFFVCLFACFLSDFVLYLFDAQYISSTDFHKRPGCLENSDCENSNLRTVKPRPPECIENSAAK